MGNSGVRSEHKWLRRRWVTPELLLFLEIQNQTDLLSLSGRTLCVTAGAAPSATNSPSALLCRYINLQLLNAEPQGMCVHPRHSLSLLSAGHSGFFPGSDLWLRCNLPIDFSTWTPVKHGFAHLPVIPALRLREKGYKFKASLHYVVRPYLSVSINSINSHASPGNTVVLFLLIWFLQYVM